MNNTESPVAIVTGASSGIGKSVARKLLERGYRVHAGARRTDAMADLATLGARVHHLDLTKPESIEAFVAAVLDEGDRIDVLVNNAGYGFYGAVEETPMADARAQMDVNVFGLAHAIQLVLPAMRRRRTGRILNVTSIGGKIWSPLGAWYHASKFAVEGLSDCLRNEVRPFGIDVVVIEPAGTATEWTGVALDNVRKVSGSGPYAPILAGAAAVFTSEQGQQSADGCAEVVVRAATVAKPKARYATSPAARVILFLRWILPDVAFDGLPGRVFKMPKHIPG
ncbi:MAG: SDR family NAD(P)-dependent oxidoreductase [Candidatus Eremiobacteraeota bacterium]|nr:SDR family NAD(P)-dependent oxidoreductase [Candidatus Eremiobacteraeota bacterium]